MIGSGVVALGVLVASVATSMSEGPAVSDLNAKLSGLGGTSVSYGESDAVGGVAGSVSMPLTYSLGLQFDAGYARVGDGNFGSGGAHLFWRDPAVGLFGVYAGYAGIELSGVKAGFARTGLEAQYFTRSVTLDLAGGYNFGDLDRTYGRARLQFYPTDNLMLRGGWAYESANFGTVGMEYQFSSSRDMGFALFADANINDSDNYGVLAGLKVTFGQDMTLKDRHRRQDPEAYTAFDLQSSQKEAIKKAKPKVETCPAFQPSPNLCSVAALTRSLPRIGYVPQPAFSRAECPTTVRLCQCIRAGYTSNSPGPAACGCAAAYATCA
jgi:hypothetical protein